MSGIATSRAVSPGMEAWIERDQVPVLDHGFIRVVDYMGDDAAVVQAARVSYGAGTKSVRDDRALIRYLMRHRHSSPFEMCEIKIHVKMPIFVARQWIRHRTAQTNEISARYSILDREFYLPAPADLAVQSSTNRQGRGDTIDPVQAARVFDLIRQASMSAYDTYEELLNDSGDGTPVRPEDPQVARELSRMSLSLNYYTQWYWKVDLHNLLHFLSLRADPHAQLEIRRYAEILIQICRDWVPFSTEAFEDFRLHARTLSRQECGVLKDVFAGVSFEEAVSRAGLSKREISDLKALLGKAG